MNFNLKIKNLFIGLCTGVAGLPTSLRDLAYKVHWIEFNFQNSKGKTVKPEIIITSDTLQNTVMLESKSGGNIEKEQYERYSDVNADDLRQRAFVKAKCVTCIDISYVVPEEAADKASGAFDSLDIKCPLIEVKADCLKLKKNKFSRVELNSVFNTGISVNYEEIPCHFIPFDNETPSWIVAEKITPILLSFLFDNKSFFTVEEILEKIIPMWEQLSDEAKRELKQSVSKVLDIAAGFEFNGFIRKNRGISQRTHTETWDVEFNPLKRSPSKRSKSWRQFQSRQKSLIERLRTGKKTEIQFEMF